jgi:hypothetical protein
MGLIDDRARLFGKINLIDAIVLLLLVGLVPTAYAAYRLFRVPVPTIIAVEPRQVTEKQTTTLQLTGTDFRPYLRARFGTYESGGFLVQSPTQAEIKVPSALPVGTYDLTLYDEGRKLVSMPSALTVVGSLVHSASVVQAVSVAVQVVGVFVGLSPADVRLIHPGATLGPNATIVATRQPEPGTVRLKVSGTTMITPVARQSQVPAIVRLGCNVAGGQCLIGNIVLAQDAIVSLPVAARPGELSERVPSSVDFLVTEVRSIDAPALFPAVSVAVQAIGVFVGLSSADVRLIHPGATLGPNATIVATRQPEPGTLRLKVSGATVITPVARQLQVPAIVRLGCNVAGGQCLIGNIVLAQDAIVSLPVAARPGELSERVPSSVDFLVTEVRSVDAPARFPAGPTIGVSTLRVRFIVQPEIADLIHVGDTDVGGPSSVDSRRATVTALDAERQQLNALGSFDAVPGRRFQLEQPMVGFTATLSVPVVQTRSGWQYKDKPVKLGAPFVFETANGFMEGSIVSMRVDPHADVSSQ